ncbi:hydroxyacid dehydrogenase [Streptomyces sp. NBC_00184]|uniref:hydroxyacid dehydrogenase n=1 Tax=Streptomyces sp. NBC_00184 TaxID=2975673 RepID=UPI002E2DE8DE|nr:hydroxyacid dehydrogenase [Streptomyces sp. NBC_00184]
MRTTRPRAAVVLSRALKHELFGPADWADLAGIADVVAECEDSAALSVHPRRHEAEVLVTSWGMPRLTEQVLSDLPALRVVAYAAGSVRGLVSEAVWARDIVVVSAAEANNEPVAEYVYAQTVLALKDVHRRAHRIKTGRELPSLDGIPGIYGQPVGLVSFGSIARKVAARLHSLETNVMAWDPYLPPEDLRRLGVKPVDELEDLCARSLVLSVHAPLIPGRTEKLITGELLRRLPHGATVINTARGAVMDEDALIDVLGERPDLYAVLDVTTHEPLPPASPLYTLPNVMLTGHVAGTVSGERRAMGRLVIEELRRVADGASPLHAVSADSSLLRA